MYPYNSITPPLWRHIQCLNLVAVLIHMVKIVSITDGPLDVCVTLACGFAPSMPVILTTNTARIGGMT